MRLPTGAAGGQCAYAKVYRHYRMAGRQLSTVCRLVTKEMLTLYGLKWNPFTPGIPAEGLWVQSSWTQADEMAGDP